MNILSTINSLVASTLDALAMLAAKILPIAGAGVTYTKGCSWRVDAWKEDSSRVLQVGGFEARIDL